LLATKLQEFLPILYFFSFLSKLTTRKDWGNTTKQQQEEAIFVDLVNQLTGGDGGGSMSLKIRNFQRRGGALAKGGKASHHYNNLLALSN